MRLNRILPACAAVLVLAACGSDPITAPAAPEAPRFGVTPKIGGKDGGLNVTTTTSIGGTECTGTTVLTTHPDGSTTLECQTDQSKQTGSGG